MREVKKRKIASPKKRPKGQTCAELTSSSA
jgi:hypothetical protein